MFSICDVQCENKGEKLSSLICRCYWCKIKLILLHVGLERNSLKVCATNGENSP
jgi:hypothetical protein